MEKMVSGRYLGEIYGHALADILGRDKPFSFTSIDLSAIVRTALRRPSVSPQALPSALMGLCARLGGPPALSGRHGPACISDCFPT